MFKNLKDIIHECKMDNLFNSINLAWAAYSLPQKVKIHGVIWKSGRGVPPIVFQEDLKGKHVEAAQGTVKAAVLKGDSLLQDLIIASRYNQKPFYMISHSIEQLTWVECKKRVWSHLIKRNIMFKFLQWNLSDDYNYEMNDNDIADQLHLVYRLQMFQCNEKWWWALFMWGFEATVANSYMMMRRCCELKCVRVPYSHHDFHEKCGLGYLDLKKYWPCRKSLTICNKPDNITPPRKKPPVPRAPWFDEAALCPDNGRIKKRLDSTLNHMPTTPLGAKGNVNCQLHRWANREMTGENVIPPGGRQHVMLCRECDVNLCLLCWEIFLSDILAKKSVIFQCSHKSK